MDHVTRLSRPFGLGTADGIEVGMESGTILVVEHNAAVGTVVSRLLRSAGYRVVTAASAEEALRIVRSGKVDLLLTDVCLPQMAGHELAAALVADGHTMPVLLMSGHAPEMALTENFLQKPFTRDDLIARVREVVARPARARAIASAGPESSAHP